MNQSFHQLDLLRPICEPFASIRGGQYSISRVISQSQRCRGTVFYNVTFSWVLCGYPSLCFLLLHCMFCFIFVKLIFSHPHFWEEAWLTVDVHTDDSFRIGHVEGEGKVARVPWAQSTYRVNSEKVSQENGGKKYTASVNKPCHSEFLPKHF